MSNNKGLLITNNNIYGIINPPPKPSRRDGATRYQDVSSAAVRWDVFVDFSNNFVGSGGGGGSVNAGEYDEDVNGNFTFVSNPAKQDISGIYFDNNNFDVSFNTVSGKENIYVGLKSSGTSLTQDYIDEMFYDPPKPITNSTIELNTTLSTPRLDASWNNPTQRRAAFDFLGTLGPKADNNALINNNPYTRDDFNYLPYFQGLKIQYLCYNTDGTKVIGTDWSDVPNTSLNSLPTSRGVNFWNSTSENFLPRFIKKVIIYSNTSTITDVSTGIILFPDFTGSGTTDFSINDKSSYAFALPTNVPGVIPTVSTNGKQIQLRVAMMNRAMTSINDPSYNSGHGLTSPDVSWNWVYMPDISGIGIGNYGAPTAPLTFTIPTPLYDSFTLNGQNDNDGNGNVSASLAVVEKELFTPFSSLSSSNPSLPKVRYRYDLSGIRLSTSKQVGGNLTDIDISKNLPDTDVSANWFPSTANPNSNPNTWTDTIDRSRNIAFPEHRYEIYGYSMRYNFDPSGNKPVGYTDASNNTIITALNKWSTPIPDVDESTNNHSNNGYNETLPNFLDNTVWQETTSSSWSQSNYFVSVGAIKAYISASIPNIKTNLLFLNNGLDTSTPFNTATTIQLNSGYTKNIRANSDDILGIDTIGGEIVRIRSNIYLDGTTTKHSTDLDLSGVQLGFQGDISTGVGSGGYNLGGKAKDVSNNFLGWKTSNVVNAYDKGDLNREGGYYCGITLSNIDISNVNLINYPDVSNNSNEAGYKAVIYQELSGNSGWTRKPTNIGDGWNKIFNIATRPIEDITLLTGGSDTSFNIMDGYNGTNTYTSSNNKFKFGSTSTTLSDPSANFFGLPMLANNSVDIINYKISLENLDETWWPTNNNLIGNLKLYFKGDGTGTAPSSSNFINWNSQIVNKPWSGASNSTGAFPELPSSSNTTQTLTGDFDFNGTTTTSFATNKYSRNLMDTGYTPSLTTPLFFIEADYDNNILRNNRGVGTGLESGTRRSLDTACSSTINRFNGKGVGPLGNYTLFWDFTFNNTVTFQNVGEIGSSPYNEYPFCQIGTSPNFASDFSHNTIMTGKIAEKQLLWAKDGFKHGQWATSKENPYINYTSKYWFGHHLSSLTVNYLPNNITGETIGTTARTYNSSDVTPWYDNSSPSNFTIHTGLYKVLVIKITKPTSFNTSQQPCCSLELKLNGSFVRNPDITNTQARDGSGVLVWMLEDAGGTSSTFSVSTGYNQSRTGWKATHKREDTAGQGGSIMNENNMGCLVSEALHTSAGDNQGVKVFDLTGAKSAGYDIYFRILIPNSTTSISNSLSTVRVSFYNRSGSTVSSAISTVTKDWSL